MRALSTLCLLLIAAQAGAEQIYKWKDANGVTHYGDKPGAGAKPADLPDLMIYGSARGAKKSSRLPLNGPAPFGGSGPHIEITHPPPDSTLIDPAGRFTVGVAISPALAAGQALNYYLDGELQNPAPTSASSFLYSGADKGDHMLSVAVIADDGRELSRSEPVIIHLQPARPIAQASPPPEQPAAPPEQAAPAAPAPKRTPTPGV